MVAAQRELIYLSHGFLLFLVFLAEEVSGQRNPFCANIIMNYYNLYAMKRIFLLILIQRQRIISHNTLYLFTCLNVNHLLIQLTTYYNIKQLNKSYFVLIFAFHNQNYFLQPHLVRKIQSIFYSIHSQRIQNIKNIFQIKFIFSFPLSYS